MEIFRLLTEKLGGIKSEVVYAHKGKYYLYGSKVLLIIPSRKQIDLNKFEREYNDDSEFSFYTIVDELHVD